GAFLGADEPQVGAALVDDPAATAADAREADAVVLVEGDLLRLDALVAGRGVGRLADDVGGAETLADVIEVLAVGTPHRRPVLADEVGRATIIAAVGVAQPDVVVGGAAVALTVPRPGAADVGDAIPGGREDAVLTLGGADAPRQAAVGRHGVQLEAL